MQDVLNLLIYAVICAAIYIYYNRSISSEGAPTSGIYKTAREAIEHGNIPLLKMLIDKGFPINSTDEEDNNNSLLHVACSNGKREIVEYLLNEGAEIDLQNDEYHTPIMSSFLFGHTECIILLLEKGADDITSQSTGNTILHDIAANVNIQYLIDGFSSINTELSESENSSISNTINIQLNKRLQEQLKFVRDSNIKIAMYLLSKGFDLTRKNKQGLTVMDLVRDHSNNDIGLILAHAFDNEKKYKQEETTALSMAVIVNKPHILTHLLDKGNDINERDINTGETALYCAALHGNNYLVKLLIERGANINIANYKSRTPLMIATLLNHKEILQTLLNAGAHTEIHDYLGETPLFKATTFGNQQAVKILLSAKANPNCENITHNTPLMRAAKHGFLEIAKMLVDHGADVNYKIKNISVLDKAHSSQKAEVVAFIKDEIKKNYTYMRK